jgi:hypothetical protein
VGNPSDNILRRKKASYVADADDFLVSGESARHSGLYTLEHDSTKVGIAQPEVFIRRGTTLPVCQDCGNPVLFRLVKKMDYIAEDPDFR